MLTGWRLRCVVLCMYLSSWLAIGNAGLYNETDDVEILDHTNFSDRINGKENAWIVEFYNTWCGHCIQFAPIWKQFGKDVRDWSHTVKVGVIDCAAEENIPLCREYEIMAYPTIKLFAPRTAKGDIGSPMPHATSSKVITESLIDFLVDKQKANNGSKSWANLQSYNGAIQALLQQSPVSSPGSQSEWVVLVIDRVKSYAARALLLDLASYPSIVVRYKEATQEDTQQYGSGGLPVVKILNRQGMEEVLTVGGNSRDEIRTSIMEKLSLRRGMIPGGKGGSTREEQVEEGGGDGQQPEEINRDKLNYGDDLPDTAFTNTEREGDQVYMVDIENALSYAIHNELAREKVIEGPKLVALREFLDVLVKYLPARPQVLSFLGRFRQYVLDSGEGGIEGGKIRGVVESLQSRESLLPSMQPWIGCAGSRPNLRQYPCGLWSMFHVLTVNAAAAKNPEDPLRVIGAIHGYIKHFFGCTYCSEHFQAMYAEDAETSVKGKDDGIMWLWRGHNKVNKRLAGDLSEDPSHPKVQFPPSSLCPSCWEDGKFVEREVSAYLKKRYSSRSLSFKGTQPVEGRTPPRNRQEKVHQYLNELSNGDRQSSKEKIPHQNTGSWRFTNTDISLCVFLYGASTMIIMAVYCYVVIRRKMRRRRLAEVHKLT